MLVSQRILAQDASNISSVVINSGCANACTGAKGEQDSEATINKVKEMGFGRSLVMSTGVIGPFLDMDKINLGLTEAAAKVPSLSLLFVLLSSLLLLFIHSLSLSLQ